MMRENLLVYQAKSFYNAYIALEYLTKTEDPMLYRVPMIVNGAFSIELTLKAILTKQGIEYKKDHNIKVLFDKLPSNIQQELWVFLVKKSPLYSNADDREKELIIMSEAFVNWRYCFDTDIIAPALDTSFLAAFANAAIYMMFKLGYNIDIVEVQNAPRSDEEINTMYEQNREHTYTENL